MDGGSFVKGQLLLNAPYWDCSEKKCDGFVSRKLRAIITL
jgi:hypothetical protein